MKNPFKLDIFRCTRGSLSIIYLIGLIGPLNFPYNFTQFWQLLFQNTPVSERTEESHIIRYR